MTWLRLGLLLALLLWWQPTTVSDLLLLLALLLLALKTPLLRFATRGASTSAPQTKASFAETSLECLADTDALKGAPAHSPPQNPPSLFE